MDNREINKDRIIEYYEQQLINNYSVEKERQKTNRFIALLIAIILISLFFIYGFFVIPGKDISVEGNSKAVIDTNIDNGSKLWQLE